MRHRFSRRGADGSMNPVMPRLALLFLCAFAALAAPANAAGLPSPGPLPGGGYLAAGSAGDAVREVQRSLGLEGDGIFGPRT